MYRTAVLAGLTVLSGCSTHPITGREQILALPALQAAHAETRFALTTGVQRIAAALPCMQDCGEAERLAAFARRTAAIGAMLEAAARDKAPDLFERIKGFQIEVNDNLGIGTGSSAGGRIALGAGLAGLEPTDTVLAFLIAREMAHVIARHAEEDSGASLVFSVLGMLLLPGFSLILRTLATTLGSSVLKSSWAADQLREADEIAVALLQRTGTPALHIALALETGLKRTLLPDDEWGAGYLDSTQRVVMIAVNGASPPTYTASGN